MASAIKILPHYTYEDYIQWEGKWELIDGIPYAMSPSPTPKHQYIANSLGALFYIELKKCNSCKVLQAVDYKIAEDTIVQPDLSILCKEATKKYIDFPPALVVEILSPSTAIKDRFTKADLYHSQRIPYYIIISAEGEESEVYTSAQEGYKLAKKGKAFSFQFLLEEGCMATIDFGELWK
jgi:Uma2 family endonuclease